MPESVAFVWDGGTITDAEVHALTFPDPEIVSAALHTLDEMTDKVGPIVGRRIAAAVTAAQTGTLLLCNDGAPA
ncbi:hypothetical protein [Saccharomonospora sp. CUA-673]|uniref:hypothetical protein n=1 Tax=Saccharomonospora sp. CUA-673 TaxID=1904969 RepID=UPI0035114C5E